jgi:hypothetical protein
MKTTPHFGKEGTWLEPEEWCYPRGNMTRRCLAKCEDGKLRVCKCGLPDTFFSIPASARIAGKYTKGFITYDDGAFVYHETD